MPVTLVTSTSTGIGHATALRLAHAGHRVVAAMRSLAKAAPLVEAAKAGGSTLEIRELDVTDAGSIDRAVTATLAGHGAIDKRHFGIKL